MISCWTTTKHIIHLYLQYNYVGHYDRLADKYDQFYGYRNDTMAELAIKWTSITPNDKVVDIGGGSGGVAEIIKTKAGMIEY